MVYSTCSFNPVENEAAVAELLRQATTGSVRRVAARVGLGIGHGFRTALRMPLGVVQSK